MLYKYTEIQGAFAFSTTRHGGVSTGAYASFNANHYCGDDPKCVEQNRRLLCERLGISNDHLIVPHQTHDTRTLVIDEQFLSLDEASRKEALEGIDAVCTNIPGVCVCVSTADCIPILIQDKVRNVVAAVHAGWRGTVARIVEATMKVLSTTYGTNPSDCVAVIGPGISLAAFEVGDEVYEAFEKAGFEMGEISKRFPVNSEQLTVNNGHPGANVPDGFPRPMGERVRERGFKWHIDLPLCNKLQLLNCGLKEENITLSGICTFTQSDDFFSARKLTIKSGRILNGILINSKNYKFTPLPGKVQSQVLSHSRYSSCEE